MITQHCTSQTHWTILMWLLNLFKWQKWERGIFLATRALFFGRNTNIFILVLAWGCFFKVLETSVFKRAIHSIQSRHHCPRDPMRLPSACATSVPFCARYQFSRVSLSGEKDDYIWKFLGGFFISKVLKRHDKYQKTWLCQGNPARWT